LHILAYSGTIMFGIGAAGRGAAARRLAATQRSVRKGSLRLSTSDSSDYHSARRAIGGSIDYLRRETPVIDSVLDRMQAMLQAWEQAADSRAVFLGCYQLMTRNVHRAIQAGEFHDAVWVSTVLHRFAGYYFEALEADARQDPDTPAVWRRTFNAARQRRTAPVQNLLLGVNAHINYDLVLTLVDTLDLEWAQLSPEQREQRRSDHDRINDILGDTVDSAQDLVLERYTPWMDLVDKAFGRLDEWMISRVISNWRTRDWEYAMRWLETPGAEERDELRRRLEAQTLGLADVILLGRD
jgi:hypothetical protein